MGRFLKVFGTKEDKKFYEQELKKQEKLVNDRRGKEKREKLVQEAKFDALPARERAGQRLSQGFNLLKAGSNKLIELDRKLDQKYREQGGTGGVIQSGYKRDLATPKTSLLREKLNQDASNGGGLIERSLRGELEPRKRKR